MPSLQALPQELIHHIVDLLVEIDIGGAINLVQVRQGEAVQLAVVHSSLTPSFSVQTCRTFSQATGYHRVRYLYLREKNGYPRRKRLPHNVRHEADLLLANQWPHLGSRHCTLPLSQSKGWHCVPTEIQEADSAIMLSGAARLHGECIYDVAADGLSLYRFQIVACKGGADQLSDGVKTSFEEPVLCYDIDVDENVLVILAASATGLRLSVLDLSSKTVKQTLIVDKECGSEYRYVGVNGGSVLVSLDNNVQVFDWKQRHTATEGAVTVQTKWARQSKESSLTGKYVRASLLSPDVVACTVLSTLRTIGSMRVCQGVVELYRLDQYVPRVADILLPEASVDALQPRILQDPRSYISFDLGGKTALQECLARGHDGPAIIQTLSDTVRVCNRGQRGHDHSSHSSAGSVLAGCLRCAICCTPKPPWPSTLLTLQSPTIRRWGTSGSGVTFPYCKGQLLSSRASTGGGWSRPRGEARMS